MRDVLRRILEKKGDKSLWEYLTVALPNTDFSSLLLEVFRERTDRLQPAALLRNYENNRLVQPLNLDAFDFARFELRALTALSSSEFELMEFSPVVPLGTSSVIGKVHQHNVLSAVRNVEVVSDVTNAMALEVAKRKRNGKQDQGLIKLAARHRLIRGQRYKIPGYTAHFKLLSLVTAGRDRGGEAFEWSSITDHVMTYQELLKELLAEKTFNLRLKITILTDWEKEVPPTKINAIRERTGLDAIEVIYKPQSGNDYYQAWRFNLSLSLGEAEYEIIDGGLVNWTQQLLHNKKERLLISAVGLEYLYRVINTKTS